MKCDEVRRLIVSLSDGALVGARAEAVRAHLAGCEGCREALEQLAADMESQRREERPEILAHPGTRSTTRERQGRTRQWLRLVARDALVRVVSVALVAIGIWLGTTLARATVGKQPNLADRLAQVGLELPNGDRK